MSLGSFSSDAKVYGYNLASRSMDLQAVAFPTLVAADDGWVSTCLRPKNYPCGRQSQIKKYNRRHVVLHDSNDRTGQADRIKPAKPAGLYAKLVGRKIIVSRSLRPLSEAPFQFVCDVTGEERHVLLAVLKLPCELRA